jgi:NAD(P)-dependent dehydrogenase (short-subunit alcohol dehydrogenase family)
MARKGFTDLDVPDQSGRTFFVTGANTGIGFEASRVLASRGARVLLGCRDRAKASDALAGIEADHAGADVEVVELDLGDLASVEAAARVVAQEPRLDGLVNNAGIMMVPYAKTNDGFESQFGVNHLGHFALTGHLLPLLERTEGARIVNTSSNAHRTGEMDWDDLGAERKYNASLMGATWPEADRNHYFGPSGLGQVAGPAKVVEGSTRSRDVESARRLWQVSEELTGVRYLGEPS